MSSGEGAGDRRPVLFHGWIVVGAAFVVLFLGFGSAYSFSVFFDALQDDFGASRASVSLIFSIAGCLYFLLGAVSGPLADRVGPRRVVVFGIVVVGLGLILSSRASSILQVYLAYGLGVGVGVGFAYVPAVGAVQRWFVRRRGVASGIAVTGIGFGTLCMPPLAALIIEWQDWRGAYLMMGIAAVVIGGGAALLVEDSPARRGMLPDGAGPVPDATKGGPVTPHRHAAGVSLQQALRARPFWMLYIASFLICIGLFLPFVHLIPHAQDAGFGKRSGVMLFAMIGAGSTAGRFVLGGLADRWGRRVTYAMLYAGIGIMLLWWAVASSLWELAAFAFVFGTFYGGFVALAPAVIADYFDGKDVIGLIGALYTSVAVGSLVGPTLAGFAYDHWQSYTVPILASAALSVTGAIFIMMAEDPASWRARALSGQQAGDQ